MYVLRSKGFDARGLEPDEQYARYAREQLSVPVDTGFVQDIAFPEGTKIQWLVAGSPPLIVLHKPGTIRKIEKYMGLEPYQ